MRWSPRIVLLLLLLPLSGPSHAEETDATDTPPKTFFKLDWTMADLYQKSPTDELRGLLGFRERKQPESKPRPWMGVNIEPAGADLEAFGGKPNEVGARFTVVVADSPAAKADIQKGDLIVTFGGKPIPPEGNPVVNLIRLIHTYQPGDAVAITVLRDGERVDLNLVLGQFREALMPEEDHPELAIDAEAPPTLLEAALDATGRTQEYATVQQLFRNVSNIIWSENKIADGVINPFRLTKFTYAFRHPSLAAEICSQLAKEMQAHFNDKTVSPAGLLIQAAADLDVLLDPTDDQVAEETKPFARLSKAFAQANARQTKALAGLTDSERELLLKEGHTLYLGGTTKNEDEEEEEDISDPTLKLFRAAYKVDYTELFTAALVLARELEPERLEALLQSAALEERQALTDEQAEQFQGDVVLVQKTAYGTLVIGGPGQTIYRAGAAVIIDLGGDDLYFNTAGVAQEQASPFSVIIDAAGNDTYTGKTGTQGFGYFGAGFLIDLDGDDSYRGENLAQGSGLFGVGMVLDFAGDDSYRAQKQSQGTGLFGIGILADRAGNDIYYAEEYCQGFGAVKGFGAILDVSGQDVYNAVGKQADGRDENRSFVSFAQGVGLGFRNDEAGLHLSGGIGLIADAAGHDHYVADYFSQASAYWFSMGIICDDAGGDHYFSGRYSQGAGIHHAVGALLDRGGDDHYTAYFGVSQGCGHDIAIGIIADDGGNDKYTGGVITLGAGNDNGIGIILDRAGYDEYSSHSHNYSVARGSRNDTRKTGSFGLIIDLGEEKDFYSDPVLRNNGATLKTEWGLLIDYALPKPKPKPAEAIEAN